MFDGETFQERHLLYAGSQMLLIPVCQTAHTNRDVNLLVIADALNVEPFPRACEPGQMFRDLRFRI